jgi:hypothetical protein
MFLNLDKFAVKRFIFFAVCSFKKGYDFYIAHPVNLYNRSKGSRSL